MDANNPLDVDAANNILHQILRMEPWFYEIHTAYKPFFSHFPLLQPYIAPCFKFRQQFPDGYFINFPKFFIDRIKYGFNMIELLFLEAIYLFEFQAIGVFPNIINLKE